MDRFFGLLFFAFICAVVSSRHHHHNIKHHRIDPTESYLQNERLINELATCDQPRPKLIYIGENELLSGIYEPPCAFLYRCGKDSGCCGPREACVPSHEETVHVYLQNTESGDLESFKFVNHTKCVCRHDAAELSNAL